MTHRFPLSMFLLSMIFSMSSSAQPSTLNYDLSGETWDSIYGSEEGGGGSSYLGVDIADVSPERLGELKLKEEHGAEVTMVDQDAPAGKAGLKPHDVIVSLNGTAVESTAQLRRMIKETPPGRVVTLGISRDGQPLTLKVQLADRHKSSWPPNVHMAMPEIPAMPAVPDFDMPAVSVVMVHSSVRTGLMVENITAQLGEFFGVKNGNGVLVRSVEKGSRAEKAGFRAGDVVVKVNTQSVHDTSDFTHALRSTSGTAAVTVMREKREQNLTLTLPEKKDSGSLQENSFDEGDSSAEMEQALNRAGDELAEMSPAITREVERAWNVTGEDAQERLRELREEEQDRKKELEERKKEIQNQLRGEARERTQESKDRRKELEERRQELRERERELRHELTRSWAEI
ncbi:MAG TPA: PDZ domain-containing protein [Terriglobales bacterium]|nr:PDZ domain-containing protein [Terriglobales bacterium]